MKIIIIILYKIKKTRPFTSSEASRLFASAIADEQSFSSRLNPEKVKMKLIKDKFLNKKTPQDKCVLFYFLIDQL